MRHRLLPLLGLLAAAPLSLPAQDEAKPIKVEMVALVLEGEIKGLEYATADPLKTARLDVYSRGLGTPVFYEGPPELAFFRTLPQLVVGAPSRRKVLATGRIPAGASRILLLFHRKPGEKESYQLLVLNNDLAGFPPGALRFFNLAGETVAGKVGRRALTLKHGAQSIVEPEPDEHGNTTVQLYREVEGKPQRIYSSQWGVTKANRTCIVLLPPTSRIEEIQVRKFAQPVLR